MSSLYASMLKRAQEIQKQDEEELESRNILPLQTKATMKETSLRETRKDRDSQAPDSVSTTQEQQYKKLLEQEKLSRQVYKEEISFLHCSGARDLNTK
jgi:hypothetical protein